jgi:hypothetical protein
MRRIIAALIVSVDGFIEGPHGERHKLAVRDRLTALAREAKLRHPAALAAQLALLLDGAWIAARTFRRADNPAGMVAQAAKTLIQKHARPPSDRRPARRR